MSKGTHVNQINSQSKEKFIHNLTCRIHNNYLPRMNPVVIKPIGHLKDSLTTGSSGTWSAHLPDGCWTKYEPGKDWGAWNFPASSSLHCLQEDALRKVTRSLKSSSFQSSSFLIFPKMWYIHTRLRGCMPYLSLVQPLQPYGYTAS